MVLYVVPDDKAADLSRAGLSRRKEAPSESAFGGNCQPVTCAM